MTVTMSTSDSKAFCKAWGMTKSRLSADVWYWGYVPKGVRDSRPTGRLNPGGAILAFVVAIGAEIIHPIGAAAMFQNMRHCSIDIRVAVAAALVRQGAVVADPRKDQPMFDVRSLRPRSSPARQ